MDNLTDLQKHLYNKHLIVSRQLKNKPFRIKKDFSDIINTDKHKYLKRLSILFAKHPEIDPTIFFEAPYKLYPDVQYFGLDYFSSMRAVKAYTSYKKILLLQSPDTQLEQIKQSLEYIAKFCIEKQIYLHQYSYYKESDHFVWMKHYKENKINLYSVFMFSNIFSTVKELAEDVQKFYLGDFVEKFQFLHANYQNSQYAKPYLTTMFNKLNIFVETQLKTSKLQVSYK